jgi:hypothetical protein
VPVIKHLLINILGLMKKTVISPLDFISFGYISLGLGSICFKLRLNVLAKGQFLKSFGYGAASKGSLK